MSLNASQPPISKKARRKTGRIAISARKRNAAGIALRRNGATSFRPASEGVTRRSMEGRRGK